ncbi:MAG: PHP domain-containing protein [Fusobacteriota bacterium]
MKGKKSKIDLHLHTTCSDGTFTPSEIINLAKENDLKTIAITDHDTIDGLESGRKKAEELGINFINGIEFSTNFKKKEIHILGYFFDKNNSDLLKKLKDLKNARVIRAKKIIKKLAKYNINITKEDIMKEVHGDLISRTHIAKVLFKKGFVKNTKEAFNRYIGERGIAFVPKLIIDPFEAIDLIKKAGGLSFLAHPKLLSLGERKTLILIDRLCEKGLDGIETFYPSFRDLDKIYYERIANERGLLLSGGSDFHGKNRDHISIGQTYVPEEKVDWIEKKFKEIEDGKN